MPNLIVVGQAVRPYASAGKTGPFTSRLSRSLKVIGTDTDRSDTCDFLLAFYSSHWPVLYSFQRDTGQNTTSAYLARELQWAVEVESRRRVRSALSQRLVVRRTRLRTVGDRAFSAVAPRLWNNLPADVVTSQSLCVTFKERLKTFLFEQSFDH